MPITGLTNWNEDQVMASVLRLRLEKEGDVDGKSIEVQELAGSEHMIAKHVVSTVTMPTKIFTLEDVSSSLNKWNINPSYVSSTKHTKIMKVVTKSVK